MSVVVVVVYYTWCHCCKNCRLTTVRTDFLPFMSIQWITANSLVVAVSISSNVSTEICW